MKEWSKMFDKGTKPHFEDIRFFVSNDLLEDLFQYIDTTYNAIPKIEYSGCAMQPGWNIKYKKYGRSLCTIYPMDGYFIVLVVLSIKDAQHIEMDILTSCSDYTKKMYSEKPYGMGQKWMMMEITNDCILKDVYKLIQVRTAKKQNA